MTNHRFPGDTVTNEQLLGEIEDLLRSQPSVEAFNSGIPEGIEWIGRAAAVLSRWDATRTDSIDLAAEEATVGVGILARARGRQKLVSLLQQARADLRMSCGLLSVVVPAGAVFDYFDELRKVIEPARVDVFFVDPYLDAEVVSRYLPHVGSGVPIRLLGGQKCLPTLLPAVQAFAAQYKTGIQLRTASGFQDRYLFVDRATCYLSGASFKDGAKKAPAVLTQISDALQGVLDMYEGIWNKANVEL